jgi:GNAT superfamily N-acetyltransferase
MFESAGPDELERRLALHLRTWLGAWPPATAVEVVGSAARVRPGWDGKVHSVIGVQSPDGMVLSVPPVAEGGASAAVPDRTRIAEAIAHALGRPAGRLVEATFRWCRRPADLPEAGVWLPIADERVPEWLHPFGGDALVALERDRVVAGVGIKLHDRYGQELAVVTEPGHEGKGLARRLVSQAARRVIANGAVPTYLHADSNLASARVAQAAGFPDLGWRVIAFASA